MRTYISCFSSYFLFSIQQRIISFFIFIIRKEAIYSQSFHHQPTTMKLLSIILFILPALIQAHPAEELQSGSMLHGDDTCVRVGGTEYPTPQKVDDNRFDEVQVPVPTERNAAKLASDRDARIFENDGLFFGRG
jgi:hypothetical protein